MAVEAASEAEDRVAGLEHSPRIRDVGALTAPNRGGRVRDLVSAARLGDAASEASIFRSPRGPCPSDTIATRAGE